mgnify:CR=1 FL=1
MINTNWDNEILSFIELSSRNNVRMIMVGGGAVNFHGYQRHSADVDFWIDTTEENFKNLVIVFNEMGYEITDFPDDVKQQLQNISVKFSPYGFNNSTKSLTFNPLLSNSALIRFLGIFSSKLFSINNPIMLYILNYTIL